MNKALPDPGRLYELATAYWPSAALHAANNLSLFEALANKPLSLEDLAVSMNGNRRAVEILVQACAGLELLIIENEVVSLSPLAKAYLVPGGPAYLGSAIGWAGDQFEAWSRLPQTVRSGKPAVDPALHLGNDAEQTRRFVLGMHERAMGTANAVVGFLDLEGCRNLLDAGGGPGTYSALLAKKYPELHSTVLDLQAVVAIADELLKDTDVADRVTTKSGDATTGDYGEGHYDSVLFSGILHQMGPITIQRMLQGAYCALKPGGRVIVSDMMLDDAKTTPLFSALFSVQMLLTSSEGAVFSKKECAEWLSGAHFGNIQTSKLPPPLPYTVVSGLKQAQP